VYLNDVPDEKTLMRWTNVIQPKMLEKFNERIMLLAVARKVTKGLNLRTDGTVVESNIHAPSDNRLLADGVRVLARTVMDAWELLQQNVQEPFEDFTQAAKQRARQITEPQRKNSDVAKEIGRQQYQEFLEMTRNTVESARHLQKQLHEMKKQKAKRWHQILGTFLPRAEQVVDQTARRIFQREQAPTSEKIVSLFEEHIDIIPTGDYLSRQGVSSGEPLLLHLQDLVGRWLGEEDGVVIVDGSGFPKQGKHWVGVAHQYCGALGKIANCQEGVFLVYASRRGYTFVDERLYLPEEWFSQDARPRWNAGGIPVALTFCSEPELGLETLASPGQV
jgi:hypothetical protein